MESIPGSLLVLLAYGLLHTGRQKPTDYWYLILNGVGSALLLLAALDPIQIGFILLNVVWLAVTLVTLGRNLREATD